MDKGSRAGGERCATHLTNSPVTDDTSTAQDRVAITPTLESKLPVLRSQLVTALLDALSKPTVRKSSVVILISLLIRLKADSAARNTFLQMRSQVIKSHIRSIRLEGNINTYIADLAIVCFTGIKHTTDWFLASFKENNVASCRFSS